MKANYPNKPRVTNSLNAYLLGVDWGHLPIYEPVYEQGEGGEMVETEFFIKANAGQNGVVPAWVLYDFLYSGGFNEMRKQADEDHKRRGEDSPFELDVKMPKKTRPFDQEAFEEALRRASRKTSSQPESESDET